MNSMDCEINKIEQTEMVDKIIIDRLAERQRMLNRMIEWEVKPASKRKWLLTTSVLSIAACLLLVFITLNPFPTESGGSSAIDLMGRPDMTSFRAACPELTRVEELMDAEDYEEALNVCKKVLHRSDVAIKEYNNVMVMGVEDEELEYELDVESTINHDIRWTYIYLLLKTGNEREVQRQLDKCMKSATYCNHIDEISALKKKLKKK